MLGQADVLRGGKAAIRAVGTSKAEGGAGTDTASTAGAARLGAALSAIPVAAIPLVLPTTAETPAMLKVLPSGAECKASAARSRGPRQTSIGKQQRTETKTGKDANGGAPGDMIPLVAAAAEHLALHHVPPIARLCPALGMVQVAAPQEPSPPPPPPASVHGGGGLALLAPLAVKVESDKDLPELRSKGGVAAAAMAAEGPPTTVPATPVVTATGLPTIVPIRTSAVAAAVAPAIPVTGTRAVKVEVLQDIARVEIAGLPQPTAAPAAEVIMIDISDSESAGASAGVGCNTMGGGGSQQPWDGRFRGSGMNMARVKYEVGAKCGAAAAAATAARPPVVAGAASIVGALETEAGVGIQAVGDQRVSGGATAGTASPTDEGGEHGDAFETIARGAKHGKDELTPAGVSGGLSVGVTEPFIAVANAAGGADAVGSRQAVVLGDEKSMAAVVNCRAAAAAAIVIVGPAAAATPPPNVHQSSPTKPAAPGVVVATPIATGSGLQAKAVNPAVYGGSSAEQLVGLGGAAGEEPAGAAVGAAASSPLLHRLAEVQRTAGATAAAVKKEAVIAGVGAGKSEIAAAGGQVVARERAAAGAAKAVPVVEVPCTWSISRAHSRSY